MLEQLKKDLLQSRKDKDETKTNILRVIIGDIERGKTPDALKVISKTIESNQEVLSHREDQTLVRENQILKEYLPTYLTDKEIQDHLIDLRVDKTNFGKAMGQAIGYFKSKSLPVRPANVKNILEDLLF